MASVFQTSLIRVAIYAPHTSSSLRDAFVQSPDRSYSIHVQRPPGLVHGTWSAYPLLIQPPRPASPMSFSIYAFTPEDSCVPKFVAAKMHADRSRFVHVDLQHMPILLDALQAESTHRHHLAHLQAHGNDIERMSKTVCFFFAWTSATGV